MIFYKSFFYLFFFINISAQINLNNFGNSEILDTYSGYPKFLYYDINKDGINDILLFGNKSKSFVVHEGLVNNSFSKPSKKFFFYPIDEIKWLNKSKRGIDYLIFISRTLKLAGLVSFTKTNSLMLLNTIEFNSYPSNIKITDLNGDNKNEAVIYGTNFDGLALITNDDFKLSVKNIVNQKVFSDVVLLDLNQDNYDDLITINFINNSLIFYENLSKFNFSVLRELEFDEVVSKIKLTNFNEDEFDDLILLREKGFNVLLGDSVYSFAQNLEFKLPFKPNDILISDINNNNSNDIVVLNQKDNLIRIFFDTNNEEKYVDYNFNGLGSIAAIHDENKTNLLINTKNGKIYFLNTHHNWGKPFNFFAGGKFSKIKPTKNNKSYLAQILLNRENNTLKTLEINSKQTFTNLSSYEYITSIDNFEEKTDKNLIAGYSKGGRNIELINTSSPKIAGLSNNLIYSEYPIQQIEIEDNLNIIAIQNFKNKLYFQQFINKNKNYSTQTPTLIDSLVINSYLNNVNDYYYWVNENNALILNRFFEGEKINLAKIILSTDLLKSVIFVGKKRSNNLHEFVSIVKTNNRNYIFLIKDNSIKSIKNSLNLFFPEYLNENNFWLYKSPKNTPFLYYYDEDNMKINEFTYNSAKNELEKTLTVEGIKSNDYFVEKFFLNRYLVYSNSELNCISYKLIR